MVDLRDFEGDPCLVRQGVRLPLGSEVVRARSSGDRIAYLLFDAETNQDLNDHLETLNAKPRVIVEKQQTE